MDALKIILENPITAISICCIIMIAGLFVGFFFRRKASEQALEELLEVKDAGRKIAEKVVATKTFDNAADHQTSFALSSQSFACAVGRVVANDRLVGDEIRKIVFDHPQFNERVDGRIAHKDIATKLELDLRFERLRSEFGNEVRAAVSGSQTAILTKLEALSEKVQEIQAHQRGE